MSVIFKPEKHLYESLDPNENIQWTSVTKFVEQFKQKFDPISKSISCSKNKKSKWYGMDPKDIQAYWASETTRASSAGTFYHSQRESDISELISITRNGVAIPIIRPIFIDDIKHAPEQRLTEGIYPEHFMYLKSAGLCGQSDRVEVVQNTVDIIDYKGLALDTPIATTKGWKIMNNIEVGDYVFDRDGIPTMVKHVSDIHINPCYKITFDTNDTLICDHEHKWVISFRKNKVEDKEQIMTTNEIFSHFNSRNRNSKVIPKIKCNKSLVLPNIKLPIDPYILGAWLGDGSKSCGIITNIDSRFWNEIKNRGYKIGNNLSKNRAEMRTVLNIRGELNKLNLLNNKGIPDIYLRSSHKQRLDLLRGLMDTDGYFNNIRKRFVMATTQLWQAEDISKLISSLGWKPTIIKVTKYLNGRKFLGYDVCFKAFENPFIIRNKECMTMLGERNHSAKYRIITNIEKINTVLTRCIAVDSNSHTYLAGYNLITTHNTNKEIRKEGYRNWEGITQKMLGPCSHLDDCNFNHYSLQLSFYLYMILKHNPRYKPGKLTLHHIIFEKEGEDKFGYPILKKNNQGENIVKTVVPYECPYLKDEVRNMIIYVNEPPKLRTK